MDDERSQSRCTEETRRGRYIGDEFPPPTAWFRVPDFFLAHDPHTSQTTRERTMGSKRGTTVANDYGGFRRRVMVAVLSY